MKIWIKQSSKEYHKQIYKIMTNKIEKKLKFVRDYIH